MRTKRVERLLKLIQALQSGRSLTADDLSEMTGVTRRTVFRDLKLLAHAGIRYTYDRETRRYSTHRDTLLPPVSLTHAEAMTLMLAAREMVGDRWPLADAVATSASLKLESMLPPAIVDYCGPLVSRMEIRGGPVSDGRPLIDTMPILQNALAEQRKIQIRYDSYHDRDVIEVVVHPYRIAFIHRGWYLIGFAEPFNEVRTFKIERVLRLRMLDETFLVDSSFSLDRYFGNAWLMIRDDRQYHVKIRFLVQVAANVDEIMWHRTQHTTFEPDGSLIFEVDVDGLREISWWVLGYGDQAQVLEPPELRTMIAERAAAMYRYYRKKDRKKDGKQTG